MERLADHTGQALCDEACHTLKRPSTREFVRRNRPGAAYIYFNYGVHWMLNVLVKNGPRKLTQALAITKRHHELDLCADPRHSFHAVPNHEVEVVAGPRIGISRAREFPWRFSLRDSEFVSVSVRRNIGPAF